MKGSIKKIIEKYQKRLNPIIKTFIKNKTLLDVGCGNGLNSFFFHKNFGSKPTLLDIEDIRDKEVTSFPFFKSSVEKMPFESKTFDVVFVQYVLHHLSPKIDIKDILKEVKRVGRVIIIVEEIQTPKTDIKKAKEYDSKINKTIHPHSKMHIYKYYSDTELKSLFMQTGLKIIKEKIIHEGCKKEGFLQWKIYVTK